MILLYIGIFISYILIMKIHIYEGARDIIPLNEVPFYKDDTAEKIKEIELLYSREPFKASDRFDVKTISRLVIGDEAQKEMWDNMLSIYDDETSNLIRHYIDNWIVYTIWSENETDFWLCFLCTEYISRITKEKTLRVEWLLWMGMWAHVPSYRWFLKDCNIFFKWQRYDEVDYYFPVAHSLRPDLSREDYDSVRRVWAKDDFMGFRCYTKKLNK